MGFDFEMLEVLENIFSIANIIILGIGGAITWLYMSKYDKTKNISAAIKDTKVNNVDGDRALIEQLDILLLKVATMSESMLKVQAEVSELTNIHYAYKSAIHRIKLKCDEFIKEADSCKECIDKILEELNLLK